MADKRITELAAITAVEIAADDVFPLVDVSDTSMAATGTTKRISSAELAVLFAGRYEVSFFVSGNLVVGTGTTRWYAERAIVITNVVASVGTAPTGASAIFDVNKNGTTIFSTQANRPTIVASAFVDLTSTPNVTTLAAGDYLTIDVDQVGSTVAGAGALIVVRYY